MIDINVYYHKAILS